MSRLRACFRSCAAQGRAAFVPYLVVGDPDLQTTASLIRMLVTEGADIIELGVPFSDPVADGPVNQRASERALRQGVRPRDVVALARGLREEGIEVPFVLFSYLNPLLSLPLPGPEDGIDGILCVDLPPEEADEHVAACIRRGVDTIFLTAPTTTESRLRTLDARATGFVYHVSSLGVTGVRTTLSEDLEAQVERVREAVGVPVVVGFGIGDRNTAERVRQVADGWVVGSALVATIEDAVTSGRDPIDAARRFVRSLH